MLQIDLEKAFDCVDHGILLAILDHVNVGSVIRDGVALAYQNCTTRLIVNKSLGAPIKVQRSVRQGCPLSPLLFCLYIETLCMKIINDNSICGFRFQAAEVKLLAYADDIALFASDQASISKAVETVRKFSQVTGSGVNWSKCLGTWHGSWLELPALFANVPWTSTPGKYLGVPLNAYRDSDQYWKGQVKETREKAEKWKGANLSIFARATVCNLFFMSKLWYVMQVLHCSRMNVQKIHRIFATFVWASGWERCSRTNLFRRVKDGGLGLGHLFLRQLVNRFLFFRDATDPFLRTVCQMRLGRRLPEYIVSTEECAGCLGGFYREIVLSVRFLSVRFTREYLCSVKRKELYFALCDVVFPVPWFRSLYSGGTGSNVLKRVKKMQVPPAAKTFFFKLHTGTLPVKTFLEQKGFFLPWGSHCLICKVPETVDHVFLHCWEGVYFWDVLQRTMKKDLPLDPHGIRFLNVDREQGVPFDLIMLLGLHSIWRSRMAGYHVDKDARPARIYFRESVNWFIEIQKASAEPPEWLSRLEPLTALREF